MKPVLEVDFTQYFYTDKFCPKCGSKSMYHIPHPRPKEFPFTCVNCFHFCFIDMLRPIEESRVAEFKKALEE